MAKIHSVHISVSMFISHPDDPSPSAHVGENAPVHMERTFHGPGEMLTGVTDLASHVAEIWTETD